MKNKVTIISGCEFRKQDAHSKNYEPMSKRLVHSIRTNGGRYKDVDIIMWHAENAAPSAETQAWLVDASCTVVGGEPLGGGCEPVGNKIIAAGTPVSTEYSLWMDSDMYVLDAPMFEVLLDRTVDVAAVGPEYGFQRWAGPTDDHIWQQFYALAGVDPPSEKFVGGLGGDPCTFYFNSALVLFKNGRGFPEAWRDIARAIRASGIENCQHNFTQTSLTVAAVKTADTYEQLPGTYNAYWSIRKEQSLECAILHYQSNESKIIKAVPNSRVRWGV
jgi:hypothetical protein